MRIWKGRSRYHELLTYWSLWKMPVFDISIIVHQKFGAEQPRATALLVRGRHLPRVYLANRQTRRTALPYVQVMRSHLCASSRSFRPTANSNNGDRCVEGCRSRPSTPQTAVGHHFRTLLSFLRATIGSILHLASRKHEH
jgi:hypothetical protein